MAKRHLEIDDGLRSIVQAITREPWRQQELMQDAQAYLLQIESDFPDRTGSWYRQRCRFHLLDELGRGRSVDSWRHRHLLCEIPDESDGNPLAACLAIDETTRESASARDILSWLMPRLDFTSQIVLMWLIEGYSQREIARLLDTSHETVRDLCRKIAALALELGIAPPGP